jgi:hypothetical protein
MTPSPISVIWMTEMMYLTRDISSARITPGRPATEMANDGRRARAGNHDPPMTPATRPLDILVQLLSEVVLELSAKVRWMEQDRMREFAL